MTRLGLALVLFSACASRSKQAASEPPYTGPLPSPGERVDDFLDRQRIVATYRGRSMSFDAVLQKRGDELTLLGLTPFGSRAFVVTQKGREMSFQSFVDEPLPFSPLYMLIDVHRVFFRASAPSDAAVADGARTFTSEGEIVTETWHMGRLLNRTFSRSGDRASGKIVVEYDGGMAEDAAPPAHLTFTNGWYGYRLDITTISHKAL
jgi:uncharacterized protein DUF3261